MLYYILLLTIKRVYFLFFLNIMIPLIYPIVIVVFLYNYTKLSKKNILKEIEYEEYKDSINNLNSSLKIATTSSNQRYGVLIRAVNPTASQMSRYKKWRLELPPNYDMHLLLSSSYSNDTSLFNSTTIITLGEIKKKYPKLTEMVKRCRGIRSILWITHTESIIMWYKKLKQKYSYIWILEQDIGVTGNIYSIMSKYEDSDFDLITFGLTKKTYKWGWSVCVSNEYHKYRNKNVGNSTLYTCREYFQRWSNTLFTTFEKNLDLGMHAASEASIAETAIYSKLKVGSIPKENIGAAFCGKSFNKSQWNKFSSNPSLQNKIFHPLKY